MQESCGGASGPHGRERAATDVIYLYIVAEKKIWRYDTVYTYVLRRIDHHSMRFVVK